MAYSDFSLTKFRNNFHITIKEEIDLFATVEPIEISEKLTSTLEETTELALAINTEKARSEMIITPILLEVRLIIKLVYFLVQILMLILIRV